MDYQNTTYEFVLLLYMFAFFLMEATVYNSYVCCTSFSFYLSNVGKLFHWMRMKGFMLEMFSLDR